jgi:hypothetical protein
MNATADMAAPDIVRRTLEALDDRPGADDTELAQLLRDHGVPRAGRALALVRIAFGRRLLDGIGAPTPAAFECGREIVLAAEPVFAAAAWIARTVDGRGAVLPVGMQSPEVQAVNAALHSGSAAEDIVLDPPLLA